MKLKCQHCAAAFNGRSDKKFCSIACKNTWHAENRMTTRNAVSEIDGYLHRNREILATLSGNASRLELDRLVLTRTGFKYEYHTGTYLNQEGKTFRILYDYAWIDLTDKTILIVRKKQDTETNK